MLDCINSSQHLVFVHWSELNGSTNINWCGLFFNILCFNRSGYFAVNGHYTLGGYFAIIVHM